MKLSLLIFWVLECQAEFSVTAQIGNEFVATLIKDIFPGPMYEHSSGPGPFTPFKNKLYFEAETELGEELWATDGTSPGTTLISDIVAGENSSSPEELTAFQDHLYFSAKDEEHGTELWISDGDAETKLLKDINTGVENSYPRSFTEFQGKLWFMAKDTDEYVLWSTDGTEMGTQPRLNHRWKRMRALLRGEKSEFPVFNGRLYFVASNTTSYGKNDAIWSTDGSDLGTYLVKDISPGYSQKSYNNFVEFNNALYFIGKDELHGSQLWKTDGATDGTVMENLHRTRHTRTVVIETEEGKMGWARPVVYKDRLYFAYDDGVMGEELWSTDGTSGGATIVKDINEGIDGSSPANLFVYNDKLFFKANDGVHGAELWVLDESGSCKMVMDMAEDEFFEHSSPENFVEFRGKLFFTASTTYNRRELGGGLPEKIFVSDGTSSGTQLVRQDEGFSISYPRYLKNLNDKYLVFMASVTIEGTLYQWELMKIAPKQQDVEVKRYGPLTVAGVAANIQGDGSGTFGPFDPTGEIVFEDAIEFITEDYYNGYAVLELPERKLTEVRIDIGSEETTTMVNVNKVSTKVDVTSQETGQEGKVTIKYQQTIEYTVSRGKNVKENDLGHLLEKILALPFEDETGRAKLMEFLKTDDRTTAFDALTSVYIEVPEQENQPSGIPIEDLSLIQTPPGIDDSDNDGVPTSKGFQCALFGYVIGMLVVFDMLLML